jgi:hypothetical protein
VSGSAWDLRSEDLNLRISPAIAGEATPGFVDVEADRAWGAGAQDPVLRIGGETLTSYSYPAPNVIRFYASDAGVLASAAEISIGYGQNEPIVLHQGATK